MSRPPGFRAVAACAFESWDGRPSTAEVAGLDRIEARLAFDGEDAEVHVYGRLEGGMPWARVVANGRMTAGGRPERVLYDGPWAGLLPPPSSEGNDARGAEPGRPWQSLRRYDCDGRTGEVTAERDGEFFDDVKALLRRLSCPPPAGARGAEECGCCGGQDGEHLHRPPCEGCYMRQGRPWPSTPAGPAPASAARAGAREALAGRWRLGAERQEAVELAAEVERLADKLAAAAAHFAGVESPYPYHGRCREMALAGAVARALLSRLGFTEKE